MNAYSNQTLLEDRIYAASPAGLTLILMEQSVATIRNVREALRDDDPRRRAREVTRLLEILSELLMSLKGESEQETRKRRAIYASLQSMLIEAHATVDGEKFATVETTLNLVLENWREVCRVLEGSALVPAVPDDLDEPDETPFSYNPYVEAAYAAAPAASRGWKL